MKLSHGLHGLAALTLAAGGMLWCVAAQAAVVDATTPAFRLSIKHDGIRQSAGEETLTYSSQWDGDAGATVTIAQDGVAIAEGLTGEDSYDWGVTRNGTYVLTHTTYTNGVAGAVETATFVVTGKDVPFAPGDVTVASYSNKYDGVAHGIAVASEIAGFAVKYGLAPDGEFTAEPPTLTDVGSMTVWVETSAPGYITETNSATIMVTPREVTLTSGSDSKVYDGTALVKHEVAVGGDGFVVGEGAMYFYTGTQTVVGESGNAFTYTLNDGTKAGNYSVTTANGTLAVTKATNAWTHNPTIAGWTYGQAANVPDMGSASFGVVTVSYSATPQDAGTYTATFTVSGTENYSGLTLPVQFTIARKSVSGATVTLGPTLTYNGVEQTQAVTGVKVDGMDATYTVSGNTATDAGYYTLTVTGTGNFTGSITAEWKIWPDGIVQQVTSYDGIYDGEGHGIEVNVTKPATATVKYAYSEQGPYSADEIIFTNVTETAVTVWYAVEAANYTSVTNSGTVKISPKTLTDAMVTVEDSAYVYDGNAKEPSVTVADGEPSILTADDYDISYSGNVNAGEATVTVTGKGNYTGTVTKHFDIAKAEVTPPTSVASKVYTGGLLKADISATARYSVVNNGGVDVGGYPVTLTLTDAANYRWAGGDSNPIELTFTITKASNEWITEPSIAGWTYGQAANVPNMGAAKFGVVQVAYSATPQSAGSYTATFTVPGTANYTGLSKPVQFTIAKATYDMSGAHWGASSFTYDGNPHTVTLSGLPSGVGAAYSGNSATAAGNYTAHATLTYDTANYNAPSIADKSWSIARKSIAGATVTLGPTLTYNGEEQTQAVTGVKIDGLNATYTVSGNTATDAGDYALTVMGTGNFTGSVTAEWKIWPDGIVQQVTSYDGIYDGEGHGIAVMVTKPATATVKYAYSEQGPYSADEIVFTNVTETAVTVWYAVEAANYTSVTNSGTVKISPKTLTDAMVTVADSAYTYDGTAKEPVVTVADGEPSILTADDYDVAYSGNVNVGEATVTVTGKGNYTGTVTKHFDIAKAEVTPPASVASKAYTGGLLRVGLQDTERYTVADGGGVDVGNYPVTLTLTDAANYRWAGGDSNPLNLTFTITKAANEWVTSPSISGWTYGQAANVPNMGAAKFGAVQVAYSATPQSAGSYTATFTVPETANYTGLSKPVQFTIAKATYDMGGAHWDYAGAFKYDGTAKAVHVSGLPLGVTVSSYSGNSAAVPGTYTAHATLAYDTVNYNEPVLADLVWEIKSEDQVKIEDAFESLPVTVEPDGEGGWKVTVTNDLDLSEGPLELPDNLGPITLDLGGHNLIGASGADGDETTPGGNGKPAILIVPSTGDGSATELSLVSTGGDALVKGGNGGAGNPGGDGAPAVEVSENAKSGVRIVIGDGVTVQGGNGGAAVGEGAEPGNDAPAVEGGDFTVAGGTLVKVNVVFPTIATAQYTGLLQTAAVPGSPLYDVVQNADGVDAGQYDVKLRLVNPKSYTWPGVSGADATVKFTIAKAANAWTVEPSIAGWTIGQAAGVPDMGAAKFGTVRVTYALADGGDQRATLPSDAGSYVATFSVSGTANYNGLVKAVPFVVRSAEEEKLNDIFEDLPVEIEPDGEGGWKVTLTDDLDLSDGPLEIPDNLGPVTLDLGGHDLIGADGADGDGTTPGGNGKPAIVIVPGEGGGSATEISVVTTAGDALVKGGNGGAGNPGGNGAAAIEVSEGCQRGVKVNVGAGVTVQGGDGGFSETGRGGDGGAGIDGDVGMNGGAIIGGAGGASVSGDGGDGGPGVDGDVDVNGGTIAGGDGGVSEHGRGGDGGMGVTGSVGTNNGTISGGEAGGTVNGTPGDDGKAVGGTVGGGTGVVRKVKVAVPEVPSAEYTGEAIEPAVPESPHYAVSASGGTRPGSYPVMLTLLDAANCEWIPRDGATVNGALAVVNFVIVDPPPRIETEDGGRQGRESAASVEATYDGMGHGISVKVTYPPSGAAIRYALTAAGPFVEAKPLFTNAVDAAETWYELSADGFDSVTNMATVTIAPRSIAKSELGSLRFEDVGGVRTPVPELVDDLGHVVPSADYDFRWSEEASGAMTFTFTGRGNYFGLCEKRLAQTRFRVTFDANGGTVDSEGADFDIGTYYGVLPTPVRAGYVFDGWYESLDFAPEHAVSRNTEVIAQDLTLHAKWLRRALWYTDAKFHLEAAAVYDGYVIDPAAGDVVVGTVQVKAGKPNRSTGVSKLSVTVQLAGAGKVQMKGETFDGSLSVAAKDGRQLELQLGEGSLSGRFGRYALDGSRNIFAAKDADSKVKAAQALKRCQGTYIVAWRETNGWSGVSIAVGKKGKVKVKGTLANGVKVSANSQLLVGERECALAVSWTKKSSSMACLVWFRSDDTVECGNMRGVASALIADTRDGAYLVRDAAFRISTEAVAGMVPGALVELVPDGLAVGMRGAQFSIAKPGKVKLLKDKSGVDLTAAGSNPSRLTLSYSMSAGTFKGKFTVYSFDGRKLKKVQVQVTGVVIGGKGYGTASVRKAGSCHVTIE